MCAAAQAGQDSTTWPLRSAGDLACLDAGGADVQPLAGTAADHSTNGLDVGIPAAAGAAVGVRYGHAEARTLAADIADSRHGRHSKREVGRTAAWAAADRQSGNRTRLSEAAPVTPTGGCRGGWLASFRAG